MTTTCPGTLFGPHEQTGFMMNVISPGSAPTYDWPQVTRSPGLFCTRMLIQPGVPDGVLPAPSSTAVYAAVHAGTARVTASRIRLRTDGQLAPRGRFDRRSEGKTSVVVPTACSGYGPPSSIEGSGAPVGRRNPSRTEQCSGSDSSVTSDRCDSIVIDCSRLTKPSADSVTLLGLGGGFPLELE